MEITSPADLEKRNVNFYLHYVVIARKKIAGHVMERNWDGNPNQDVNFLNTSEALVPPKPKEFDMAMSTFCFLDTLGT